MGNAEINVDSKALANDNEEQKEKSPQKGRISISPNCCKRQVDSVASKSVAQKLARNWI